MAFLLSYKPDQGQEDIFNSLSENGKFVNRNVLEQLMSLATSAIHPAETLETPCIGESEVANKWAKELHESILKNNFVLDYPLYFNIINFLDGFYEVNSLVEYCKKITSEQFVTSLKGLFVYTLIPWKEQLPEYSQIGKGGIPEWSFNVFNYDYSEQDKIYSKDKLSKSAKQFAQLDILTPSQAIEFGTEIHKLIPQGQFELFKNLKSIKGYPDLMPFEENHHRVGNLGRWFINWGQNGHYFLKTDNAVSPSMLNEKIL